MRIADQVKAGSEFESLLAETLKKSGRRVRLPSGPDSGWDLIIDGGAKRYVVNMKISSEGRSDRLIPLLSQAILEVQAAAHRISEHAIPVAVVAAKRIPASVAERLKAFAKEHAPKVGVGIIDLEGFRSFVGYGLEVLDAKSQSRAPRPLASPHLPDLFSDLNQWMLKILLGQHLPQPLIAVPRVPIKNASQLAAAANVSVMSASRLVHQLGNEGFLNKSSDGVQLVRVDELLEWWVSANRKMSKEIAARWILKKDEEQFLASVARFARDSNVGIPPRRAKISKAQPRCCVGVFSAADLLGVGFVRGVPPHIYLERVDADALRQLGLSVEDARSSPDVQIRIPSNKEAVFRAVVSRDGVPVSDVLQVWLDASAHPSRGREQANEIRNRVFKPLLAKQR